MKRAIGILLLCLLTMLALPIRAESPASARRQAEAREFPRLLAEGQANGQITITRFVPPRKVGWTSHMMHKTVKHVLDSGERLVISGPYPQGWRRICTPARASVLAGGSAQDLRWDRLGQRDQTAVNKKPRRTATATSSARNALRIITD